MPQSKQETETVKLQTCDFRRRKGDDWERGVASVKGFGISDVAWIVDANGILLREVWNYRLLEGPMNYLDTGKPHPGKPHR